MKQFLISLLVFVLLLSAGITSASETNVSVSLKTWYNSWEEEDDASGVTSDFGSALMIGPAISVKFGNGAFIGGSFMKSTSDYETKDFAIAGDKLTMERQDIDLAAGYMFNPYFGVFIGYKSIEADLSYDYPPLAISGEPLGTVTLSGPGIGIMGNYAFNQSVAIYGSLAFMKIDLESEPADGSPSTTDDLSGAAFEIGLAFAFSANFSGNVGIKSQSFSGDDFTDTFVGPTFGLTYTF